ncbi:MAG: hypothetical protein KGZ94_02885 [Clostridia bacterium]|nr:hypothetical protein [Clostridia bacterium]
MSIILSIIVYLLLFIIAVFLAVIIVPIRYSFYGGYNNSPYCFGSMTILEFCKISISYNTKGLLAKLNVFGFSINIDSEITKGKKAKPKNRKDKEKSQREVRKREKSSKGKGGTSLFKNLFQRDIIFHVLYLLRDLVGILKPRVLMIKGRIGFYEPHHTAWLQAIVSTLSGLNIFTKLDIDTIWDDEHFEGELIIKGHLAIIVVLFRLLKFLISKNTLKIIRIIIRERQKRKVLKPAT